jgi:hypothetical protein
LINVDAIFETKTDLYYIMPFINGTDLEQHWIARGKRFNENEILFYTT